MEIVININATSAEDYRNAIKALMDGAGMVGAGMVGAGMVGFEIPDLPNETQPRDTKAQQQAEAEQMERRQPQRPRCLRVFLARFKAFALRVKHVVQAHERAVVRAIEQIAGRQPVPRTHEQHRERVAEV